MVKGLYTAYTGMTNEMKRLDVLTNNLANADTTGYKKEGTTSTPFAEELAIKIKDSSEYGQTGAKEAFRLPISLQILQSAAKDFLQSHLRIRRAILR